MGWTVHMIMCVLLCYPVSFHMLQLLLTGRPISSWIGATYYMHFYTMVLFQMTVIIQLINFTGSEFLVH